MKEQSAPNAANPNAQPVLPERSAGWAAAAEIVAAARPFARCQQLSYVGRLYNDKPCGKCNGCRLAEALGVPA